MCDRPAIEHPRALAGFTNNRPSDGPVHHEARHAPALARRGASHDPHPLGPFPGPLWVRERRRPEIGCFFAI